MAVLHVQPKEFWRLFNTAVRERQSVLNDTLDAVSPNAGSHVQGASAYIGYWQTWIEDNCNRFVRSHDDAGEKYNPATKFDGIASETSVTMWTWATLKTAALGGNDWTAYTDATTHTHRHIQANDHWKPILWEELAACFDMLIWTKQDLASAFTRSGATPGRAYDSFAEAEADASALYAAADSGAGDGGNAKLLYWYADGFAAEIVATEYDIQAEVKNWSLVGCTGYGYAKAVRYDNGYGTPINSWHAQGDTTIVQDQYKYCGSGAVAIGHVETVGTVGQVAGEPTTWPGEPDSTSPSFFSTGWLLGDYFSVCEWAFTVLTPIT
jgi:hypothetical protein